MIPSYNYGHLVGDALGSVVANGFDRWECLVVDDGSVDDTQTVVRSWQARDSRIHLITKANGGTVSCMNVASRDVAGELILLLDADDQFLPTKMQRVFEEHRRRPDAALLIHRMAVSVSDGTIVGLMPMANELANGDLSSFVREAGTGIKNAGVSSNFALPKEAFLRIFPADERSGNYHDELIRRIAPLLGPVAAIDEVLGIRFVHESQQSRLDDLEKFTERALFNYEAITAEYARHVGTKEYDSLADPDLVLMRMVLAKARKEGRSAIKVLETDASRFAALPKARRLFWRAVAVAPRPIALRMVSSLYSASGFKLLANHRFARQRIDKLESQNLKLASFREVVRLVLGQLLQPKSTVRTAGWTRRKRGP